MIFRVPTSTLQKTKQQGVWALVDIAAKCKTFLINRMWLQSNKECTASATLHYKWNPIGPQANPPPTRRNLHQLEYLLLYARDMAYIPPPDRDDTTKAFKKRIYNTLHTMERAATGNREMRIVKQWPQNDWDRVWRNLRTAWITDTLKSTWYNIIHDLIPTKERLAAIRLAASNQCDRRAKADTLIHRLTDCTSSADIWKWTRSRLAAILINDAFQTNGPLDPNSTSGPLSAIMQRCGL